MSGSYIIALLQTSLVLPRHIFLFDMAAVVCKRRGDNYEMKDILDLNYFKVTNNPTSDKEGKKVSGETDTGALSGFLTTWSLAYFDY